MFRENDQQHYLRVKTKRLKSNKHLFKNEPITIFKQNETPRSYWDSLDEKRKSPKRFKASKEGKCTEYRSQAGNVCCN